MRLIFVAAAAALALGGCNPGPEGNAAAGANAAPQVNAVTGGNDAATVLAMGDGSRRLTLARALDKAGLPCDGVVKAEQIADQQGLPVWRATCKNGTNYGITITPDGTANILSRSDR